MTTLCGRIACCFLLFFFVASLSVVYAQAGTFTVIQFVDSRDDGDGLVLDIYFNLVDSNNRPLVDARIESGRLSSANTIYEDVRVYQPDMPFYIALVLDASGSMRGANSAMRQAAANAVENAPQQAQFAVFSFHELVEQVQDFSGDTAHTQSRIDQVQSVEDSGTCLYDAAYRALDVLARQPQGRRALVLFTDGVDERSDGSTPCSSRRVDEVVARARETRVPIHVIGMVGGLNSRQQIDTDVLGRIATTTGGFFNYGSEGSLNSLFTQAMDALRNQWLAQARIYPRVGEQTATFTPMLQDGVEVAPINFNFTSPRDFEQPFNVYAGSPVYNANRDDVTVALQVVGVGRASSLSFEVLDQGNLRVYTPETSISPSAGTPTTIVIPGSVLTDGASYRVLINGISRTNGMPLLTESVEVPFEINRERPEVVIAEVRVAVTNLQINPTTINVEMDVTAIDRVSYLQVSVIDALGGTVYSARTDGVQESVVVPSDSLEPGGEYRISVLAYDAQGVRLTLEAAQYQFVNGTPPPVPRLIIDIVHFPGSRAVVVELSSVGVEQIAEMDITLINANTRTRVLAFEVEGVPDTFELPAAQIGAGEYIVQIMPKNREGDFLLEEPLRSEAFVYQPPNPTLGDMVGGVITNPIILGLVVAGIVLLGVYFYRQRFSKAAAGAGAGQGYFPRVTQLLTGDSRNAPAHKAETPTRNNHTTVSGKPMGERMPSRTSETRLFNNPGKANLDTSEDTLHAKPLAQLRVVRSHTYGEGTTWTLTSKRFVIGREKTGTVNFDDDSGVSAPHLEIIYDTKRKVFVARDIGRSRRGTTNGTYINDILLKGDEADIPTEGVSTIRLAKVKLQFEMTNLNEMKR